MPIQKTKFVMSNAQPTGTLRPQMPAPSQKSQAMQKRRTPSKEAEQANAIHQPTLGVRSMGAATASVIEWKSCPPRIRGARPTTGSNETLSSGRIELGAQPPHSHRSHFRKFGRRLTINPSPRGQDVSGEGLASLLVSRTPL